MITYLLQMERYVYHLRGGCVNSKIDLDLDLDSKSFEMNIRKSSMGHPSIRDNIKGKIMVQNDTHYYLYATTYNDIDCKVEGLLNKDNTMLSFIFTKLQSAVLIDEHFIEFDGMVMGLCDVNEGARYNAMLIFCVGEKFGLYQPTDEESFNNIRHMSSMYPMLRTAPPSSSS
jgi:hypothetical protein